MSAHEAADDATPAATHGSFLKRVQSGRFRPNLKSTLRRDRSKTESKDKAGDIERRKSSRQQDGGVSSRFRKVMSGRFSSTNPRHSGDGSSLSRPVARSVFNDKERNESNVSSLSATGGERLRGLARTTSAKSMKVARTASARLQVVRDRATEAASSAASRATDYSVTLRLAVSERVAQARGSDSLGDPLEPHPHKGLLRSGNEVEDHLWLVLNLPEHRDLVTCVGFSANGLFVASSGGPEDCSILLTYRNTMKLGRALTRTARLRVSDRDFVSAFSFSPSSTHLIAALSMRKLISVYKLTRRPDAVPTLEASFATHHTYPINSVAMRDTVSLSYILTCADDGDNFLKVWTPEGKPVCSFETDEVSNRKATVSPDGRVVGVVAQLSRSVQLLQLAPVEVGRYKKKGMELQPIGNLDGSGEAAVRDVNMSANNDAAYVCTEDGTWSKFSIDTNGHVKPHQVLDFTSKEPMQFSAVTCNADGSLVICASGRDLLFIRGSGSSAVFGKVVGSIKDAHDSDIASVQVSPESDCLVTCGVDSTHARVWQMPRA